jgi:type I restriction enzyme S subunit
VEIIRCLSRFLSLSKETAAAKTKNQKPMSKNSENKLIPRLRFPEFQNDGEWGNTPLEELCEVITKGTTPATLGFNYTEKGINFIKIESIQNGRINLSKVAFISNECNEALKRSQLKENDILFSIAGALGVVAPVSIKELPANTNQALSIVRLKKGQNKDYILAYLSSNHISVEISKIKAGAAQPNISLSQVSNFNILLPKNPLEQQKIASCLSSLDEVIAGERQKLALLQQHKKGLLQQLFPQEGETVPTLRFKEFEDSGEWEEIELGSLGEFVSGGTPDTTNPEFWEGEIQWFTPTEIKQRFISKSKRTITKAGLENSSAKLLPKGSLLITTRATIGDAAINEVDCATNQGFQSIIFKQNEFNLFWYYWLLNNKNELVKRASGSTFQEINKAKIKKITAKRPNIFEQQKIASCLSSLDDIITAQTQKIELLEQHKKGLLQGLFPNVNDHE